MTFSRLSVLGSGTPTTNFSDVLILDNPGFPCNPLAIHQVATSEITINLSSRLKRRRAFKATKRFTLDFMRRVTCSQLEK